MNAELNLNEILSQVKKLTELEQLTLLKRIKSMLQKKEKHSKTTNLTELSGLGASVWHGVNIDQYVDNERQW
ncbi:MAG TPA: hypothetical protein VJ844_09365 [Mucilaginibacter sp.]|nr:hypothetical protein [Mucilaginibacter sp.]